MRRGCNVSVRVSILYILKYECTHTRTSLCPYPTHTLNSPPHTIIPPPPHRQHTILEATRLQPPPTNTPTNTPTPSGGPLVPSTTAPVGFLGQLGAQLLLQSDPWGTLYCEGGGGEWKTRAQGSGRVLSMSTWRCVVGGL